MQIHMKVSDNLILAFQVCLAKENFACVIKYFSVATAFVFSCDAKHSDILRDAVIIVATCLQLCI